MLLQAFGKITHRWLFRLTLVWLPARILAKSILIFTIDRFFSLTRVKYDASTNLKTMLTAALSLWCRG